MAEKNYNMSNEHLYNVNISWKSERKGILSSPELVSQIEVATPPQFPKGIEGIWSPEHLLVAAINSCLMTTFLAIADNSKLDFENFSSKASGKLEMVDGKYLLTEVNLSPMVVIKKDQDKERALRILEKSEAACLISNSVKSKIILIPSVTVDVGV